MTEMEDNIIDVVVACTLGQDARVRYRPADDEKIEQLGSIAAVLRF
jgi:hypothetical protein